MGHTYITDSKGRVNKVEGELSLNKMDRNTDPCCQIRRTKLGRF